MTFQYNKIVGVCQKYKKQKKNSKRNLLTNASPLFPNSSTDIDANGTSMGHASVGTVKTTRNMNLAIKAYKKHKIV